MSRLAIASEVRAQFGLVPTVDVFVYERGTTNEVTVYQDRTGETTLTQPLTTSGIGTAPGYVDPAPLDLEVDGVLVDWEAIPAGPFIGLVLPDGSRLIATDEFGSVWPLVEYSGHFEIGDNPSIRLFPDDPSRWACVDDAVVVNREGGNRRHTRSQNLVSLDKPELVIRTFGPANTAPYGPFQDGTFLEGVKESAGAGRITFQGMVAQTPSATPKGFGPHSARWTAEFAEDVRSDSLKSTLVDEITLPTVSTVRVEGDLDAVAADDGTEQPWHEAGVARIGSTRFVYAHRAYDPVEDITTLYGCTGGGVTQASLVTDLPGEIGVGENSANLRYTAVPIGAAGNAISIEYVDPGTPDASLSVGVVGNEITVNLATDAASEVTSTGNDIVAAVRASAAASALVRVNRKNVGDGTGTAEAMAQTNLAGGTDTMMFPIGHVIRQVKVSAGGRTYMHTSAHGTGDLNRRLRVGADGSMAFGERAIAGGALSSFYTFIGGDLKLDSLPNPAPVATVIGTPGTRTITWKVVGRTPHGKTSAPGTVTIHNAPDVLDDNNYVLLTWPAALGYHSFDVVRFEIEAGSEPTGIITSQQPNIGDGRAVDRGQGLATRNEIHTVVVAHSEEGTFTLRGPGGIGETAPISVFDSSADFKAKYEALASVGSGNVNVAKVSAFGWRITYTGALAATNVGMPTVGQNNLVPLEEVEGEEPKLPVVTIRTREEGGPVVYTLPSRNSTADMSVAGLLSALQGIALNGQKATGAAEGTAASDLVTKSQLDTKESLSDALPGSVMGTVIGKKEVLDSEGAVIGYSPIFDEITDVVTGVPIEQTVVRVAQFEGLRWLEPLSATDVHLLEPGALDRADGVDGSDPTAVAAFLAGETEIDVFEDRDLSIPIAQPLTTDIEGRIVGFTAVRQYDTYVPADPTHPIQVWDAASGRGAKS